MMTPSRGPIRPHDVGGLSRVSQGCFHSGKPPVIQASPVPATPVRLPAPAPLQARRASALAPIVRDRPTNGSLQRALRPGQPPPVLPTNSLQPRALRPGQPPPPVLPTNSLQPRALQPRAPVRPQ